LRSHGFWFTRILAHCGETALEAVPIRSDRYFGKPASAKTTPQLTVKKVSAVAQKK
jgi:hypothetical protein